MNAIQQNFFLSVFLSDGTGVARASSAQCVDERKRFHT